VSIDLNSVRQIAKYVPGQRVRDIIMDLVAEVERLRDEADLLRTGREAARSYADRVEAEVVALRGERAAVVAWLGAEVDAAMEMHLPVRAATFLACAEAIECGAHRREDESCG